MPTKKPAVIYRTKDRAGVAAHIKNEDVFLRGDALFSAEHEYVRGRPDLFEVAEGVEPRPEFEAATAAPGEVRGEEG